MEESAIREGLHNMKSGEAYDNLYQAALCRAKADWLIGMNATRLYSLLYGPTLHVGRVMTPTMAMITEREKSVEDFKPEPFYTVKLSASTVNAQSERFPDFESAKQLQERCGRDISAVVTHVEQKRHTEKPPLLYDLTTLQREANRVFGFTAQQTLEYAQSLYEKKLLTYPRTDSRFLTHDMADMLPDLVKHVGNRMPFSEGMEQPTHADIVINDTKVSDHHAIIPTKSMPLQRNAIAALTTGERDLLYLVGTRLLCAVGDPCVYDETIMTVRCGNHDFTAKGKRIVRMGWQAVWHAFRGSLGARVADEEDNKPAISDTITEGTELPFPKAEVAEGRTTPPPRYTEGAILHAMETAGVEDMP